MLERETGLEPATPSLEGWCSSQLSYSRRNSRSFSFDLLPSAAIYFDLLRFSLDPLPDDSQSACLREWWREEDSNLRRPKASRFTVCPV